MPGPMVPSAIPSTRKHDNGKRPRIRRPGALNRLARAHYLSRFCQPSVMSLSGTLKTRILALE